MLFRFSVSASLLVVVALGWPLSAYAIPWDDGGIDKLWGNNFNWSPNGSPVGQDVTIGNFFAAENDQTLLDTDYSILSLTITNGADVINSTDNGATNGFELLVNGATSVSGAGSSIIIYGGSPDGLDTNTLLIGDGGSVLLNSQTAQGTAVLEVDNGLLDIAVGGTLNGNGRIELLDSVGASTSLLDNNGTISVGQLGFVFGTPAPRTLQITATDADARFDWDGNLFGAPGVLQVRGNGTLDIDVRPSDTFNGTMNLSTGSTMDAAFDWEFGTNGEINVNTQAFSVIVAPPTPGPAARITGEAWTMTGGTINLEDSWDSLELDSALVATGGTIENGGTIIFNSNTTIGSGVDFNMNGIGASLVVNATVNIATPDFNPDGLGTTSNVITINAGGDLDLDLGVGADDTLDNTINMNGGVSDAELDVTTTDNDWRLSSVGEINVAGGGVSRINGETFEIGGDINVSDNSILIINAPSEYSSSANVAIEAGSLLNQGTVTYSGGSYTGDGVFKKGTATIISNTTWDVATVDLDDGSTTINDGAWLQVNTDSIDDSGDGIDHTITVADAGFFTVNLSDGSDVVFENGNLTYNGDNALSNFLPDSTTGSALRFDASSNFNVNGDGGALVRIKLNGGNLNINDPDGRLILHGGTLVPGDTNEISGSTVAGSGRLQINTGRALRGNGTIDTQVEGFGTAQLIAEGGTLTLSSGIFDIGTIGTEGAAAVLNITAPWDTGVADAVLLNGGVLQGALILNTSANGITGNGEITSPILNDTLIEAQNGVLVVDNAMNDWDGPLGTGALRSDNGVLELRDNAPFSFTGSVVANNGAVFANGLALDFFPSSNLSLSNGVFQSTEETNIGGTVVVLAGPSSRLSVTDNAIFRITSSTTLNSDLELENNNTIVEAGASFVGVGDLINLAGSRLTLEDTATVGVQVTNEGNLEIADSIAGQGNVAGFQQEATGTFLADLAGTSLGEFDLLFSTGLAQLDGTLAVDLVGTFNPELGDFFTIVSAVGGVVGAFGVEDFSAAPLDAGLSWNVIYNANTVQLAVGATLAGDYNADGVVNAADYTVWRDSAGVPGANLAADGNQDGIIDQDDYVVWSMNFGAVAPALAESVPEPTTALLTGLLLSLTLGCRGRTR